MNNIDIFERLRREAVARGVYFPLVEGDVKRAEMLIGRTLPPLVVQMYRTCGNGRFGPEVRPLIGGNDERVTNPFEVPAPWSVALMKRFSETNPFERDMLAICDQGCGTESFIDLTSPTLRVMRCDPQFAESDDEEVLLPESYSEEAPSLEMWLESWLRARMS